MMKWHVTLVDGRKTYRWVFDTANEAAHCYANAILAGFPVDTVKVREVAGRDLVRV